LDHGLKIEIYYAGTSLKMSATIDFKNTWHDNILCTLFGCCENSCHL